MRSYRLALIGFGTVNKGLVEILRKHNLFLADTYGARYSIVGVCGLKKGSIYDPEGLKIDELLKAARSGDNLETINAPQRGWDVDTLITNSEADIIVEATYTDYHSGQPATGYIRRALECGKHVVTTNKGPIALHYQDLAALARKNNLYLGLEGTVMSGSPAIHLGREVLKSAVIYKIEGILNGTTNYILTQMEHGVDYPTALGEAQRKGYAEADPSGDVDGWDAAGKVAILSSLIFNHPIAIEAVERTGISGLTLQDIQKAQQAGERWKLIGCLEPKNGGLCARVAPLRLSLSHPLANVSGAGNAISYYTRILGQVTLSGPGAGRQETGFAILSDLLAIHASF